MKRVRRPRSRKCRKCKRKLGLRGVQCMKVFELDWLIEEDVVGFASCSCITKLAEWYLTSLIIQRLICCYCLRDYAKNHHCKCLWKSWHYHLPRSTLFTQLAALFSRCSRCDLIIPLDPTSHQAPPQPYLPSPNDLAIATPISSTPSILPTASFLAVSTPSA